MAQHHILYIGYYSDNSTFNKLCDLKINNMSAARQTLETKLLKGLYSIPNIKLSAVSYIPTQKGLDLPDTTQIANLYIPYYKINKQHLSSILLASYHFTRYIHQQKIKDTSILMYAVNPVFLLPLLLYKKSRHLQLITICSEIPKYRRYTDSFKWRLKKRILTYFNTCFDKYILLTDAMASELGVERKPHITLEGIADDTLASISSNNHRENIVMYAGGLHADNNINLLINACINNPDVKELWICGSGPQETEIKDIADKNPKITYWGNLAHSKVLELETKVKLLVNLRNPTNKLTKYSFPSKLMEYLMSGAFVISTRLEGIPQEYFNYLFEISNLDIKSLQSTISQIITLPDSILVEKAKKARDFLLTQKTSKVQCEKIVNFIINLNQ